MAVRFNDENFKLETFDRIGYQLIVIIGAFTVKHLIDVRKIVTDFMDSGVRNIIFDMEKVVRLDSTSIGLLGNLFKQLDKDAGTLGILKPSAAVSRLLKETSMDKLLSIFNSVESIDEHYEI